MDGHDPDAGVVLGGDSRLGLAIGEGGAIARLVEEAAQIAPFVRLELGSESDQLEEVRGPSQPIVHQQRREVVAERLERPLDQLVESEPGGAFAEP